MTQHKLGRLPEADTLLQLAEQRYTDAMQQANQNVQRGDEESLRGIWLDRLVFEILDDEARRDASTELTAASKL